MKKALAIDIGGTKIYNTIVNESGEIIAEIEKRSTPKTFDGIKEVLQEIVKLHEKDADVIAFATAGAVNNENTGLIGSTGNIAEGYPNMDFLGLSEKKVFVENDANAAAWAEHILGASQGCSDSIMLTLGTGVGGGIIVNNKLLKGKSGTAGEMHFKMYPDKRRYCTCGAYDCFEAYASGRGLRLTAQEITKVPNVTTYDVIDEVKTVLNLTSSHEAEMTKTERLLLDREDKYIQSFLEWQNHILIGCIGLANLFDTEVIVLSGSMAEFVDVEYLEKELNKEIVATYTKVRHASAGNYSGMIGAALLAMEVGINKEVSC